jgi:hypothetical protein
MNTTIVCQRTSFMKISLSREHYTTRKRPFPTTYRPPIAISALGVGGAKAEWLMFNATLALKAAQCAIWAATKPYGLTTFAKTQTSLVIHCEDSTATQMPMLATDFNFLIARGSDGGLTVQSNVDKSKLSFEQATGIVVATVQVFRASLTDILAKASRNAPDSVKQTWQH